MAIWVTMLGARKANFTFFSLAQQVLTITIPH
jgi:hypothetical protein